MKLKYLLKRLILPLLAIIVFCSNARAQAITLKGKVTDDKNLPVAAASVRLKGSASGAITDGGGVFTLTYPGAGTLVITAIGYETKEIKLSGETSLNVTLTQDNTVLNEVVVTALGIKREKRILTYSTQEIKGDQLTQSKEPNLVNAIAGQAAGVQVT